MSGAALGVGIHYGWQIGWIQATMKGVLWAQGTSFAVSFLSGLGQGLADDNYTTFRNSFSILFGQFYTNSRYSFGEQVLSQLSLHTWEILQQNLGMAIAQVRNTFIGSGDFTVSYFDGSVLTNFENDLTIGRWGMTLGNIINGQNVIADPVRSDIFAHEYGHVIQSRYWGILYAPIVGITSLSTAGTHDYEGNWSERHANFHGARYFEKYYPGFIWDEFNNPRTK